MKNQSFKKIKTSQSLVMMMGLLSGLNSSVSAATITIGTKIGLAPGTTLTDDAGNDWFDFGAAGTFTTINDLNGDTLDGVSVQVVGGGYNTAGENNWVGLSTNGGSAPAEFVDSVTTDLLFNNTTITISGLDTNFTYNLYSVSHGGARLSILALIPTR